MKRCPKCRCFKISSAFNKSRHTSDGLTVYCRTCSRLLGRKYRAANKLMILAKGRTWYRKVRARVLIHHRRYYAQHKADWRRRAQKNKAKIQANGRECYYRHHDKNRARAAFQYLVKRGVIIPKPCARCGRKAEGHHPDYNKPFDVKWLCRKHHGEVHRLKLEEV